MKKILIVVDPQNDFITGTLAVPGAVDAMDKFLEFAKTGGLDQYDDIFVTIDFHPTNHCSFYSQGGLFPPHCIKHTWGAAISLTVQEALSKNTNVHFFTKGTRYDIEEYSIFKSPNGLNLAAESNLFRVDEIHIMGISGDYCVNDTINDLCSQFNVAEKIVVLKDFIASIDKGKKLNNLILDLNLKTR